MFRYGITVEQYDELLRKQEGRCAICRELPGDRALHVDHDHSCCAGRARNCGKCVRGLLCYSCNTKLAWMERYGEEVQTYLIERSVMV